MQCLNTILKDFDILAYDYAHKSYVAIHNTSVLHCILASTFKVTHLITQCTHNNISLHESEWNMASDFTSKAAVFSRAEGE